MTLPSPHSGHLLPARMILRFGLASPLLSSGEDDAFPAEDEAFPAGEEEAEGEDVPCFAEDFPAGEAFPEGAAACSTRRLVLSHSTVWTSSETICLSSAINCCAL